jgi:hypothetical protein
MSTSNNGKSFEELLRQKLEGHEYEYHPSHWAKMQQKLHMHTHAASAAKSAMVKKGLVSAGKIGGGLIAVGAVVYTALSLAGVVDRSDLGLGDKHATSIVVNTEAPKVNQPDQTSSVVISNDKSLALNESGSTNAANGAMGQHATSAPRQELGINTPNMRYGTVTTSLKHGADNATHDKANDIAGNSRNNSGSGSGTQEQGQKSLTNDNGHNDLAQDKNTVSTSAANNGASTDNTGKEAPQDEVSANKAQDLLTQNDDTKTADVPEAKDSAAADQPVNPLDPANGRYDNQDKDVPFKLQAGVTGGLSVVNLEGSADNATKTAVGLNTIGAYIALPLNSRFTVQTGVSFRNQHNMNLHQYTTQVRYELWQDSTLTEFAISSAQYIDIPLLVKYTFARNFALTGGVKLNWIQSVHGNLSQVNFQNKALTDYSSREISAAPQGFRKVDLGASAGLEYRINKLFTAGASYQIGLQNSINSPAIIPGDLRNSYLQIYAAMRLF